MKKKVILILWALQVISCSSDENEILVNNNKVTDFKYSVREDYGNYNLVYTQEYSIDDDGNVISEKFTNFYSPQYNYTSSFQYNSEGRLIIEIKDNEIFRKIEWNNNLAEVYNNQDQKISEFIFTGEKLMEYTTGFINNEISYRKFNYDSYENIVSIENELGIFVEFLDYNTNRFYPLNLIKSIGILRIDYKPFFKNIFGVEKVYPFDGDDYSVSLKLYDYYYEFGSNNRVIEISDDKTLIYRQEFEYD